MKTLLLTSIIIVLIASCKKTSVQIQPPKDEFYFKGMVNGQYINWSLNANPGLECDHYGGPYFRPDSGILKVVKYEMGARIIESQFQGNILNEISISYLSPIKPSSFNYVINSFGAGLKQFANVSFTNTDSVTEGMVIYYTDSTTYVSGFGDQSTSSFETISLKDATPDKEYTKIWTARFSCKVYEPYGCYDTVYHPTKILEIKDAEVCLPLFTKSDYY